MRCKKKSADQRRREARERVRRLRQNPEYRDMERIANTSAHRLAMQDPEKRAAHRIRDAAAHRRARKDPARLQAHRVRDAAAHRRALQDPDRRVAHRLRDAASHRKAHRTQNAAAPRRSCASPEVLHVRGVPGHFITYPGKRAVEHRNILWSLVKHEVDGDEWESLGQEQNGGHEPDAVTPEAKYSLDYESLLQNYEDTNPLDDDHIGLGCEGAWYENSVKIVTKEELISKGFSDDQVNGIIT